LKTLTKLALELAHGTTTSRALVEECLRRITAPSGEGARTFLKVHAESARTAADYYDRMRQLGATVSPWSGIPISIKDLFDLTGDVTTAGSKVLCDQPAASRDARSVGRLRAAGFIPIGRTNMTEFAYSGLGINPHYGTPLNPYDRAARRIPGGSSSGAAVSITDQMAYGALGTDTGGSCRIPAAFCGIVGFKPTASRVSLAGAVPLSQSLDSVGPLAGSVQCCAVLDGILAGESEVRVESGSLEGLRFAVAKSYVLEDLDTHVARSFEKALSLLSAAKVRIEEIPLAELNQLPHINRKGGFPAAEAYAHHAERLLTRADQYDPRVSIRILRGREQSAADYIELLAARNDLRAQTDRKLAGFDAVLMPTTPMIAPTFAELESDAEYGRANLLALRNPTVTNFLDRCAISIPCQEPGSAPVGLMLMGARNADRRLLSVAAGVESLFPAALVPR
jgi:aspartyl-tRNA(Asn)/glutamyl-tRNA(Gln) amidotransferase subunit A